MSYLYPRRRGTNPAAVILLIAAGVAAGLGAAFLAFSPRIVSLSPEADARTGSYAAVEIRFSSPMGEGCTADHFSISPAVEGALTVEGSTLRFAPGEPWPAGSNVVVTIRSGACGGRGLPLLAGRSWSFTPTLVRVAYVPIDASAGRLMGIAADGGEPEVLATSDSPIRNFDVSPRGDFAVFSTAPSAGPGGLWITRLDGGPAESLLDCGEDSCRDPAVSPDGSRVAFVREQLPSQSAHPPQVQLLDIAGGGVRTVSQAGNAAGNPAWTAQGWLSYYDATRLVTVVDDLAGGRTVVPNPAGNSWSFLPDGSSLILPEILVEEEVVEETDRTSPRIFSRLIRVELKSNRRTNLSGEDLLEDLFPAVSPDGRFVAFARNFFDDRWTPGSQLWIMDLEDLTARQISLAPDYSHSSIHWSRDGSRLVYMLFHETVPSDPPEIWIVDADGANPRRLVVGGFLPQWLP